MAAGDRLRILIDERGWSDAELARRIGEQRHWVSDRTRGRVALKVDELPRLARALDVSCSAFFEGSDCPEVELSSQKVPSTERPNFQQTILGELVRGWPELPAAEKDAIEEMASVFRRYTARLRHEEHRDPGVPNTPEPGQ